MTTLDAAATSAESPATPAETGGAADQAVNAHVRAQGLARAVERREALPAEPRLRTPDLTPEQLRRVREERVWRALVRARRNGTPRGDREPLDVAFSAPILLSPARNTLFRDPNGTAKDHLSDPGPAPRVIHPHSDVKTRTTFTADADGRPQRIPADRLDQWLDAQHERRVHEWLTARGIPSPSTASRVAAALKAGKEDAVVGWLATRGIERARARYEGIRPWLDHGVFHLDSRVAKGPADPARGMSVPFVSPRAHLPGEPAAGLRGRVLPYPSRDYGRRPQSHRLHTCVACSYGKHDRHERNFDLCKDCHRIIGSIPSEMFRRMRQQLEDRGLVEKRAESFARSAGFDEIARALTLRWRAENLEFGTSAGEPFVTYPESDRITKRTLLAGPDGRPLWVRATEVVQSELRPIRGRYPRTRRAEDVDLAAALGAGLARTEDELMLAGDRSARTEESRFEVEGDTGRDGWAAAASLSDFSGQRPIEVHKGSGLSRDEIFALSDAVDRNAGRSQTGGRDTRLSRARGGHEGRRGPRRFTRWEGRADVPRSRRVAVAPRGWRRPADMKHLRAHADPLFFAGPTGESLTRHALAGALTQAERDALRTALYDRDWSDAIREDRAWDRRRARVGISGRWREHTDRSGPLPAVTPPVLVRGYSGPTGVDEELGRHEHSEFLASHRQRLDAWLTTLHNERVGEWLKAQGIAGHGAAVGLAETLRRGDAGAIQRVIEFHRIPLERFAAARDWLDEVSPEGFHRSTPIVNPAPREIGDLTPETPIRERLAATEAARAAEPANWRVHGSAQNPADAAAAIAEYRAATAPAVPAGVPPTSGTVAVQRGDAEAPLEFANARARVQEAREAFDARLAGVFADPDAFRSLFARVSPSGRRQIVETMRAAPATLEGRFGAAARLAVTAPDDPSRIRHGTAAGAELAAVTGLARHAAREGRRLLDARRDLDRARRAVAASRIDGDALLQARIEFRTATMDVFADPGAFHRAFAALPAPAKRSLLVDLAERPESVADRIGRPGRLVPRRSADPRWDALVAARTIDSREAAAAAAAAGQAYVSRLAGATRALRGALREGRTRMREDTLARIGKHFPEAPQIDAHVRLSAEIDQLEAQIATKRTELGQLDRMRSGLLASADELGRQLETVVADPAGFVARLRGISVAEKHHVFDLLATRPQDLARLSALGDSARLKPGAARYAALVAQHGRHYVENTVRYRDQVEKSAAALGLDAKAPHREVRSALERDIETLSTRTAARAAERAALAAPDLGRATAHFRALGDAERAHATLAFPHLARAVERVEASRETGASAIGRQRRSSALKEHSGNHRARNKEVAGIEL